jgi:hypothetical protein
LNRTSASGDQAKKVGVRYTFNCVLWFRKFEQQLSAEVVEKHDDAVGWSGVAFEVSARKLGSDCRH